jgi:hypothetical protein
MTCSEYWTAVKTIPLYPDWALDDGRTVLCRTAKGDPVRVPRPERLHTAAERAAALASACI